MKKLSDEDVLEHVSPLGSAQICVICDFRLPYDEMEGPSPDDHMADLHNIELYIKGHTIDIEEPLIEWYWRQKQRVLR